MSRSRLILVGGPPSREALRLKYIAALIDILNAIGSRCQADPVLAERIARLLKAEADAE